MARPEKVAEVAEVSQRLADAPATLLTHYRGLTVTQIGRLRQSLREVNAEMRVVKNTLARRAAADAGIEGLDDLFVGPTGMVFCGDDPVAPAKALKAFAKDHPVLEVRGGWFDGEILDAAAAIKLADLESREDLLTTLARLMHGALANTARLLNAPLSQQARLLQALVDAGGAEEAAPAAEEPTAEAAATEEPAADEPAADVDEPAAEEPAAEEPAAEEPAADSENKEA